MNSKKIILLIIVSICLGVAAQRPGATFLLIQPTAKATGMAYAYTAIANNASANYYNAAALVFLESPSISTTYFKYLTGFHSDMHYLYFGLVYPLHSSALGFDITYLTLGKTEIIDPDGYIVGERLIWRIAPKISYARELSDKIALGISWKFIHSSNHSSNFVEWLRRPWLSGIGIDIGGTGSSWAFDFNFLCRILSNLSVGTVFHNIGPSIKYTEDWYYPPHSNNPSDPLPWTYRLGAAYTPIGNEYLGVTLSAEVTKIFVNMFAEEENSFWENLKYEVKEAWKGIGLQATFYRVLSLRGGYFWDIEGAREGLTFGGGIKAANVELDIGIDENLYEFKTQNRKISLSYTF